MDSERLAYIQWLIGQPWERHGAHCWRLVDQIQKDLFGRQVPFGPLAVPCRARRREMLAQDPEPYGWQEIAQPVNGAVARMYRVGGNPHDLEHAGVFLDLDRGGVIHSDQPHGVVFDSLLELTVRGWVPRFLVPAEKGNSNG
jgi:hypothetical protein